MKRKSHKTKSVVVHRPKAVVRHKRRSRRGGLHAASTQMMSAAKHSGAAAIGGYLGSMLNGMMPEKVGTIGRIAIGIGLGIAAEQFANMPNVGAGAVGAIVALNNPTKGLAEFADEDTLSEEPLYLSEDGQPLMLSEDGDFYYA